MLTRHRSPLHADEDDEDDMPTPRVASAATLAGSAETPAARLRALLARTPSSPKATPMPQRSVQSSDNESDFDPPNAMPQNTPSFARESLKDLFGRAMRDPGNTPQKDSVKPRRNSIDVSEVEASPRVRERARNMAPRKSLSDEEIESPTKSSQRSEASFKSSQAATFDILRERLANSHSQIKDLDIDDSMYQYDLDSVPNENSKDTATILRDLNPSPPPVASTTQQSLHLSTNTQLQLQLSNLLEQDSEMHRAFEGFDSYEEGRSEHPTIPFPSSQPGEQKPEGQSATRKTPRRSEPLPLSHKKSQSFEALRNSPLNRRGSEELRSSSRTSSLNSSGSGARQTEDPEKLREREREWNRPKTPARSHTPELSHHSSPLHRFPRSGSPMVDAMSRVGGTLSRQGSNASLRSFDGTSSSRTSSFGSQAEYRERLAEMEKERNDEREREWNKPHPKVSRPRPTSSLHSPSAADRSKTWSLIQLDSPGRLSPARHLRKSSLTDASSRASSPAGSAHSGRHGKDDPEEEEVVHERERNWNAPRPKWSHHHHEYNSFQSPLHLQPSPSSRVRAESLKTPGTRKGESPVHSGKPTTPSTPSTSFASTTRIPPRTSSPLPPNKVNTTPPTHEPPPSPSLSRRKSFLPARAHSPLFPPVNSQSKGKGKETDVNDISKHPHNKQSPPAAQTAKPTFQNGYSFVKNRTSLPPIELDRKTPERPLPSTSSNRRLAAPASPSPAARPSSRNAGPALSSSIPVRSPKKTRPVPAASVALESEPDTDAQADLPVINLAPADLESHSPETPSTPIVRVTVPPEENEENEQAGSDISEERTPTMRPIPPPPPESPEHVDSAPYSELPEHSAEFIEESQVEQELFSGDMSMTSVEPSYRQVAQDMTIENSLAPELSLSAPIPQSPSPLITPPLPASESNTILATPPRRSSFNTSKLEFQTPSPPRNLPDLPGPPTSSEEETDEDEQVVQTPARDLRADLTAMKTPRPPGAWASTPAPAQERTVPSTSTSSLGDTSEDPADPELRTPLASRELAGNLTSMKTPRPPGAWASTPAAPPPPREPPARTRSLGDTDEEWESGLVTPVASLSRASSLPGQTPGPPGAWMATPAARKSVLKVRFDTHDSSLNGSPATDTSRNPFNDVTNSPPKADDLSTSTVRPALGKDSNEGIFPRTRTPEPVTPISPTSKRFQSPTRTHGIRVLDAFGKAVVQEETIRKPNTPRNKSGIRVLDAMGREVDDTPNHDEVHDSIEEPSPPLNRDEALVRVRQGLADLADGLQDMDRANKDAWLDYTRLRELQDASKTARAARMQLGQAVASNGSNLMNKLEPLLANMKKNSKAMQIWDKLSMFIWDCQQSLWKTFGDEEIRVASWPPT
ncbi:hypothetical protein H0H81_012488 [Sphagnurus paluster]|uniref:Uncharacterized protein n=1 Tax=Sphagnurus paluster TaxID=117069 RepID=A0A9P7FQE1_9AGAR|nr:hypothetical protein H0H81_012488 [Sphagnurus paluster]